MNKSFIPTPQDEILHVEKDITKTANFDGTTFDFGQGFAPGGIGRCFAGVINVRACDRDDSDETYTFVMQESSDANTWTDCGPSGSVDVSGSSATVGAISIGGIISKRYARIKLTVAGTTPSIEYDAWFNPNCCC